MTEPRELLVRYLRQRGEMGERELILDPESATWLRSGLRNPPPPGAAPDAHAVPAITPAGGGVERRPSRAGGAAGTPGAGPARAEALDLDTLDSVRAVAESCTACRLAATRTSVVFGDGNPTAKLLVVGEAPGADEDRTGRPFVGRAGKLLDLLLASVGFPRETVYICNVLKCRPPGNRNPLPDEVACCGPFLERQLSLVAPAVILACGTFPAQALLRTTEPIGRLRGSVHDAGGIPLIATYHPAALLRNPTWIRPVWEDLQRLRTLVQP